MSKPEYNGGILKYSKVTPKPERIILTTYYPFHKNYNIGHSKLESNSSIPNNSIYISSGLNDSDYNLITNNCADHTGKFLQYALKRPFNPILFTTPGDVRDYAKQNTIKSYSKKPLEYTQEIEVPFLDYQLARNKYLLESNIKPGWKEYKPQQFRTSPLKRNYAKYEDGYRFNRDGSLYNIYSDNPDIDRSKIEDLELARSIAIQNMKNEGWVQDKNNKKWYTKSEADKVFDIFKK